MSNSKAQVQEEVSPNLIPMVDIMFLLLLFFMLGADMGQRELEDVKLPTAESVKKEDPRDTRKLDRLTVNVYHRYHVKCPAYEKKDVCREDGHWLVGIRGMDYARTEELTARLAKEAALAPSKDPKNPHASERKVMIRADQSAPYGLAQRAMNACASVGIYQIEVGAANVPKDRRGGQRDLRRI